MKRVNTRVIKNANRHAMMAPLTYNLKKHLAYIEEKTNEYLAQLDTNDSKDNSVTVTKIQEKNARLKTNKIRYEHLEEKLTSSGEPQISTTDQDASALLCVRFFYLIKKYFQF